MVNSLLGLVAELEQWCQLPDDVVLIKRLAQLLHVARPAAQEMQQRQQQQMLMMKSCSSRDLRSSLMWQDLQQNALQQQQQQMMSCSPTWWWSRGPAQLLQVARPAAR
jgi:hypothetical protein